MGYQRPTLLEQLRHSLEARLCSPRTVKAYRRWVMRYVGYHQMRHPRGLGKRELEAFLSWLATDRGVGASTQNQALEALVYLYKRVLYIDLP